MDELGSESTSDRRCLSNQLTNSMREAAQRQQLAKPRVFPQSVEAWIHFDPQELSEMVAYASFKQSERSVWFAQGRIEDGKAGWSNTCAARGHRDEFVEHAPSLDRPARISTDPTSLSYQPRIAPA